MIQINPNTMYFLKLIKQYLASGGRDCTVPDFAADAGFEEILRIAMYNNCDPFIYHTISKWCTEYGVEKVTIESYRNRILFSAVSQIRADTELKEVLSELNSFGVSYLLLKGIILSNLYPDPAYRRAIDVDIHVSDDYADRAAEVFLARGYEYIQNDSIKYEKTYRLSGILTIELHTRLFENFYEKNQAAIAAVGLEALSSRREVRVFDMIAGTLSLNHFLIYVICHHTKHFIASGINLRHLLDICVYINEYYEQLNWDFIISALSRFGIKDFALHLLYICQHYLNIVDLSFLYHDIEEDVVEMLLYDIVERNAYNDGVIERASSHDIVHDVYFNGEKNFLNLFRSNYLPSRKQLKKKYMYAKKYPVLLPVAWVHRALSYLFRKVKGQQVVSPAERAMLAKERVELLKRVQIL